MNDPRALLCNVVLTICAACWIAPLAAQDQNQQESSPAVQANNTDLTIAKIDERLAQVTASTEIDDATKAQVKDLYERARTALDQANSRKGQAQKFRDTAQRSAEDLLQLQGDLQQPEAGFDFSLINEQSKLDELLNHQAELQRRLQEARSKLAEAQAEPKRRAERRAKIPEELAQATRDKEEIERQLSVATSDSVAPIVAQASRTLLLARQQALAAQLEMLEEENQAYDSQGTEHLQRKIDLWTAREKQRSQDWQRLTTEIDKRRKTDAQAQLAFAEALRELPLTSRDPEVKIQVEQLVDLASRRKDLVTNINQATQDFQSLNEKLNALKTDFETFQSRLAQGNTSGLGVLLIRKRGELPNASLLSRNIAARRKAIFDAQNALFRFEDQRLELSNLSIQAADWTVIDQRFKSPDLNESEILHELKRFEAALLNDLKKESDQYFRLLVDVNVKESELLKQATTYRHLIERNVFWVRSAPTFAWDDVDYLIPAAAWLIDQENWWQVGESLAVDAQNNPILTLLFVMAIATSILLRKAWKRRLVALGGVAENRTCREFSPTLQALCFTILLSLAGPAIVFYVGWRLSFSSFEFAQALSNGLLSLAFYYVALEFMQQTYRPRGLADSHFGRPAGYTKTTRNALRTISYVFLPLIFLADIFGSQAEPTFNHSLGRLCFIGAVVALVVAVRPIVKRTDTTVRSLVSRSAEGTTTFIHPSYLLVLAAAIAVIIFALSGYFFAASQLVSTALDLLVLMFGLRLTSSLLNRWVKVERRALSYRQAMERRSRSKGTPGEEIVVEEDSVDVRKIDDQSRRLIRNLLIILGFVGLLWALRDLLPALAIFERVQLWQKQNLDGGFVWVTLSDLLLAGLVFIATITLAKNLPALMEMLFGKRLPLESSVRYAIGQLSSYMVAAVGIVIGFTFLGLTWSKVQWLIAALGVGLGFGLQEIFANFVAGIILLFERPIRVGDVVTLDGTTGVVTKIQIRATTIRNWDRQDLVVPNRDLITGKLLNWTLAGGLNRITFDVGVAYGTDMNRVRELLLKILADHPKVLDDPPPIVTFQEFGDSSLNVWVAAYLAKIDERLATTHELHTTISEVFARESIEIPFPQRDLHVRSIEDVVRTQPAESSVPSGYSSAG